MVKKGQKRDTPWMFGDKNVAKRPEVRKILSQNMIGKYTKDNNHKWKGGISGIYKLKNHPDYLLAISIKPDNCDLCGIPERQLSRKLSFDHDHKTNKFRGWLCANCNRGIGLLKDSPELLEKAVEYIRNNLDDQPK